MVPSRPTCVATQNSAPEAGEDGADLTLVALVVSKKEDRRTLRDWRMIRSETPF